MIEVGGAWENTDFRHVYSDNAREIEAAIKAAQVPFDTCIPGDTKGNGRAEESVRLVVEGCRTILEKSGLPSQFWSYAVVFWCLAYNIAPGANGDLSPWEKRFGKPFNGTLLPFGCLVDYLPSANHRHAGFKMEARSRPGIFLGYCTKVRGEPNGSMRVAALEAFTGINYYTCLLYTSPSPRDLSTSRMPSSA